MKLCYIKNESKPCYLDFSLSNLQILDAALAGVVPAGQLLVEEAAEDVAALGHGG